MAAANNMLLDTRVQWMQAKVSGLYAPFTQDKWKYLLTRSDGKSGSDLKYFLDEAPPGHTVYFYIVDAQSGSKERRGCTNSNFIRFI